MQYNDLTTKITKLEKEYSYLEDKVEESMVNFSL